VAPPGADAPAGRFYFEAEIPSGSAIDPEMLLHSRHNLRIREFVSGLNINSALGKRLRSAETLLEFQLGPTGSASGCPS
jgi:hypothetical protein